MVDKSNRAFGDGGGPYHEADAQRLREMNEALLIGSTQQHELAELARRAEAYAMRTADRLDRIVSTSPVAIAVLEGPELRFRWLNPAFARLAGAQTTCIGKRFVDVVPQPLADRIDAVVGQPGARFHERPAETKVSGQWGPRWWEGKCVPLASGDGSAEAVLLVLWDTTKQHDHELRLIRRSRLQGAMTRLTECALRENRLQVVFDHSIELVADALGAEFAGVWEIRRETGDAVLRAGSGWESDREDEVVVPTGAGSWLHFATKASAPVVCGPTSSQTEPVKPEALAKHRIRSGISGPIAGLDEPWGALNVHSTRAAAFDPRARSFFRFAVRVLEGAIRRHEAAQTVQRIREELEREVEKRTAELIQRGQQIGRLLSDLSVAEQRERTRLAHVLHDHLQQILVAVKFQTQGLRRCQDKPDESRMAAIDSLLDEAVTMARSLSVELDPPVLREAGLAAGFRWLANWMRENHGLNVRVEATAEAHIRREDIRIFLYQSVRELLFNVVKHSTRTEASIRLEQFEDQVQITVADEGAGFAVDAARSKNTGGYGLFSIEERALLLGGTFTIESAPGHGTRCTLAAPMDGLAAHLS